MRSFNFDSDSSVYTQVAIDLRRVPGWKKAKKGDVNADLWIVDGVCTVIDRMVGMQWPCMFSPVFTSFLARSRSPSGRKKGAIPYAVLGQNRRPQLVNYYRGSGALTLKSSMIRTLRTYIREQNLDQEAVCT